MWGNFVENLGLKEGFAEFKEQFNKDAKTTIANTQFAKERGIDLAKLDQWEQHLQEQAINKTAELHERTIGRAVDTLAQDDTIAQLLELKSEAREAAEEAVPSFGMALAAPQEERGDGSGGALEEAELAGAHLSPAEQREPETSPQVSPAPERATAALAAGRAAVARAPERIRQAELLELKSSRDEAFAHIAELEGRLAELSGLSDDALGQADEAKLQALLLRRAVEEKDSAMVQAMEVQRKLEEQLGLSQKKLEDLEASFVERLKREVSQKEQELLDEVAYLRKAGEAKERRVQDLQAEKTAMERRLLVKASAGVSDAGDLMLEAHTAIARAFGDMSMQHPCLRLLDEPILKLMALLFQQPLFRRMFFGATAMLWVYALTLSLTGSSEAVHV
ncbi:unnamed protein product [Effrenium voratum]|uniref:Uncharacterized protein n=1 Tax=Effrenium voratum TaxID=2562239 RepID=A0AA36HSJ3_9DINO|nr:unnamed protein product [Effrenium voratum]CAJ1428784.1 unnamed protein product [Effrenium voratum]